MGRTSCLAIAVAAMNVAAFAQADTIRFATYNASLNRSAEGELAAELATTTARQPRAIAEVIQRVAPDVLLVNEFDYDPRSPGLFQENYLGQSQNTTGAGASKPISFDYSFIAPSNTGLASGFDLDNSGAIDGPGDAQGFGFFEGQFGMAVFSKYEILTDEVRTFQTFLWQDMPGARLPQDPKDVDGNGDAANWYTEEELGTLRLSSKSHWDIPILIDGEVVHFLVSHPTPPVFDGAEDRNGLRNADEIRFWSDYVNGADYIYDDKGKSGGLAPGARFVIAGDQNADPSDGDSAENAVGQLTEHPLINNSIVPSSAGGIQAVQRQAGANLDHRGDPAFDTADFGFAGLSNGVPNPDKVPGNLRVDYVLPSKSGLNLQGGGVFWLEDTDPLFRLAEFPTSDHRLVFIDVEVAP